MENKYLKKNLGFTLIELLLAMTISTVVAAGIFTAYKSQQDAQLAQKQIVEMQQNLRAALYIMTREIRMAGYDPSGENGAGIEDAGDGRDQANLFKFTYFEENAPSDSQDNDNDGVSDETGEVLQAIEYYLYDSRSDGNLDIGRRSGARLDAIAQNIKRLVFEYIDASNGIMTPPVTPSKIRAVRITIEATTDINEHNYANINDATEITRTLTTIIKCRNL